MHFSAQKCYRLGTEGVRMDLIGADLNVESIGRVSCAALKLIMTINAMIKCYNKNVFNENATINALGDVGLWWSLCILYLLCVASPLSFSVAK